MKSLLIKKTKALLKLKRGDLVASLNSDTVMLVTTVYNDGSKFNGVVIISNKNSQIKENQMVGEIVNGIDAHKVETFEGEIKLTQ
jgi:hypothetical protein